MRFSRQEYWSGLPFSSEDLPGSGIEPRSPALQADSLPSEPQGKLLYILDTSNLSDIWFTNFISFSTIYLFIFLMISFEAQNVLILRKSNLAWFASCCMICFQFFWSIMWGKNLNLSLCMWIFNYSKTICWKDKSHWIVLAPFLKI